MVYILFEGSPCYSYNTCFVTYYHQHCHCHYDYGQCYLSAVAIAFVVAVVIFDVAVDFSFLYLVFPLNFESPQKSKLYFTIGVQHSSPSIIQVCLYIGGLLVVSCYCKFCLCCRYAVAVIIIDFSLFIFFQLYNDYELRSTTIIKKVVDTMDIQDGSS